MDHSIYKYDTLSCSNIQKNYHNHHALQIYLGRTIDADDDTFGFFADTEGLSSIISTLKYVIVCKIKYCNSKNAYVCLFVGDNHAIDVEDDIYGEVEGLGICS
jgi:hypothetical protein